MLRYWIEPKPKGGNNYYRYDVYSEGGYLVLEDVVHPSTAIAHMLEKDGITSNFEVWRDTLQYTVKTLKLWGKEWTEGRAGLSLRKREPKHGRRNGKGTSETEQVAETADGQA